MLEPVIVVAILVIVPGMGAAAFFAGNGRDRRHFSQQELDQLLQFYQTPLGRKLLHAMPLVVRESSRIGARLAERHQAAFQEQIAAILVDGAADPGAASTEAEKKPGAAEATEATDSKATKPQPTGPVHEAEPIR